MYNQYERPTVKNVFLYIRQSTDEKAQRQVRSMDDQQRECEALAKQLGLNIVEIFREDKSAKHPHQRPVFKSMIKALSYKTEAKRRADGILSWHPNRLSRNALEAGQIIQMLDDAQIKDMFFPAYSFHNDASGKEHLFIEFARAKGYSDHLSISVIRGNSSREQEGAMVYNSKFGYQKKREIPDKPKLCSLFPIPCETHFPIVQRVFALRLEGRSLADIELTLKRERLMPKTGTPLGKSRIGRILTDSFYHGKWVINQGKKDERTKDLLAMRLPDGTQFAPAVSEIDFLNCQTDPAKTYRSHKKIKHINPFPLPVRCARCDGKMRPCWKQIKRTGGVLEKQLGYECQTRIDGERCKQPRLKAGLLYDHVAQALQSVKLDKKQYQRFLIGSEQYIRRKAEQLKQERIKQTKITQTLKAHKLDLLRQKATLVSEGALTPADTKLLNEEISETGQQLREAEICHRELAGSIQRKIVGFRKFIELSQNLHQQWLDADLGQKQKISEKILLNLMIENRETCSQSWTPAFADWLKQPNFSNGTPEPKNLEPYFDRLWKDFVANQGYWDDFYEILYTA